MAKLKILVLILFAVFSIAAFQPSTSELIQITILYTNDEHGWMESNDDGGGAAEMLGLWQTLPGFGERTLILSGGDMWTGPDVSTWHEGESMVEVMNAMGYSAAAVGNHEFDFGADVLTLRAQESSFPFLSSNLIDRETGNIPEFVQPYTMMEFNGINIGIIGLSLIETPTVAHPRHVSQFEFLPYTAALNAAVPELKAQGAELLLVISHVCLNALGALVSLAAELEIAMLGGGHCNEFSATVDEGVAVISGGSSLRSYAQVELSLDAETHQLMDIETSTHLNIGNAPDPQVAEIVSRWRTLTDEALSEVIGYTENGLPHRSNVLMNLLTDAWLVAFPSADVAMTNVGGFRQEIPAGPITRGDILGVLPFDNNIVEVTLTGEQLIDNIRCCGPTVGGITTIGPARFPDGTRIEDELVYNVLVTDFMFEGGSGFRFPQDQGVDTNINWRVPLIDLLLTLNTTPENPLENHLDPTPR